MIRTFLLLLVLAGCAAQSHTPARTATMTDVTDRYMRYARLGLRQTTAGVTTEKVDIAGRAITTYLSADWRTFSAPQKSDFLQNGAAAVRSAFSKICWNPDFKTLHSNGYRFFVDTTGVMEDGEVRHALEELTPDACRAGGF